MFQLLRLQRVNQNAAIFAMIVYRQLIRWRQYWLRPWIVRRSLFIKFLRTIFNSRSELLEHLLWNDAVMRRRVSDVCKPIAEWSAHAWKPLCNWSPTSRPLSANRSPPHRWSVTDGSPLHYEDTDHRTVGDWSATNLFETSRRPMKPLSDQISRGQSFVYAQKTACDQFGLGTDWRPFGDISKTFLRHLRLLCDCHFFGREAIASQSQAMCDWGLSQ